MASPLFIGFCVLLVLLQALAALPWLGAIDPRPPSARPLRNLRHNWQFFLTGLGVCVALGIGAAFYLDINSNRDGLAIWGRLYLSVLHLQLAADLLVLLFFLMQLVWPKGAAVALAAFREGLRQPMFWVLAGFASFLMLVSPFLPYFTFQGSEELKMVKNICFEFAMLAALLFGVTSAALSVHEEIEGRTAITVMSKPISRRQFFLGKFTGILLSALSMTVLLGWWLIWVFRFKIWYDAPTQVDPSLRNPPDSQWIGEVLRHFQSGTLADLLRGMLLWADEVQAALPLLAIGFCQVMVLVALATALATRLPMVVNLSFCLAVYFLGNLAPIMVEVAGREKYPLLLFVSQVFQTILPGLDLFDVSSNVTRDQPLPMLDYYLYTLNVMLYAATYSAAALVFGLILFEDRDLA